VEVEGSGESVEAGKCEPGDAADGSLTPGLVGSGLRVPNVGDILIEYHPHSGKGSRILSPEEFKATLSDRLAEPTEPPDDEPWRPFRSRDDFEFAEFVHDTALNQSQIDQLIKFIRRQDESGSGSFTLQNYNDLKDVLERASKLLTSVTTFNL